jgi:hypothetical protein
VILLFLPVKAHQQEIYGGQKKIRLGSRVPDHAVNLAYSYVPPLTPTENIQVTDTSGLILENVQAENARDIILYPDESHLLHTEDGKDYVPAETFLITNTFSKDSEGKLVPLYYIHRLQWPIYDSKGPDRFGFYRGKSITLVDRDDKSLDPSTYMIAIVPSSIGPNYYNVLIYTSFQSLPSDNYRAIYPAYVTDTTLATPVSKLVPGFTEQLNPQPAFRQRYNIMDVIDPANINQPWYYKTEAAEYGTTKIYGTRGILDDGRKPVEFHFRIYAQYTDAGGHTQIISSNWLADSCLNINSATPEEIQTLFQGSNMILRGGQTAAQILSSLVGPIPANATYHVESDNPLVNVGTDSLGNSPVLAWTNEDTGQIDLPQLYKAQTEDVPVNFGLEFHLISPDGSVDFVALTVPNLSIRQSMGWTNLKPIIRGELNFPAGFDKNTWILEVRPTSSVHADIGMKDLNTGWIVADFEGRMRIPYINLYTHQYVIGAQTNKKSSTFLSGYQVRLNNSRQIKPLYPREQSGMENWYIRIQNGRFQRSTFDENGDPIALLYLIPEYYRQAFDDTYGLPYRKIEGERPKIIGDRRIKLRYTPLFVDTDPSTNLPTNLRVIVNGVPVKAVSWNIADGSVELECLVKDTDVVTVDYYYSEFSYTYRGYYDERLNKFILLDLNPGKGHKYSLVQNHSLTKDPAYAEVTDVPGFTLIDKTIYLYLRPAAVLTSLMNVWAEPITLTNGSYTLEYMPLGPNRVTIYRQDDGTPIPYGSGATPSDPYWTINGQTITIVNADPNVQYLADYTYDSGVYRMKPTTFQANTLYHLFTPDPFSKDDILLAKIQVRPNSSMESINIIDTRSRGGGLLREIGRNIIEEIEPEANFYWDIGYWDGEPYPENSVVVIRLSENILKEYGGKFERQEVEAAVQKHIAFGTFFIIEYIHESDLIVQIPEGLVLDLVPGPDEGGVTVMTPTFDLTVEDLRWP